MLTLNNIDNNEWCFNEPDYIGEHIDSFYESMELINAGELEASENILREQINDCYYHIDAIHYLALIAKQRKMELEHLLLEKEAVFRALENAPLEFSLENSKLEYINLENRPFLRAYHGLGLAYFHSGQTVLANEVFSNLLSLNPNDNQGVRALAIECGFVLKQPDMVIGICERFPDDCMVETLYGYPLALFQIGMNGKAMKHLTTAKKLKPLVAESLLAKIQKVHNATDGYIMSDGKDEAFMYRVRSMKFWESTPQALELLKRVPG